MELLLIWIVGGIVVAMIASSKGCSGFAWFLYGFLILPIAFVHALLLGNKECGQRVADYRLLRLDASGEGFTSAWPSPTES